MTKDEIFAAMEKAYTGAGSTVEGSFAGDILRACADGCAELWSTEIDGLEERAFVASAAGEWLTRVCADRGVERRAGEDDETLRSRALESLKRQGASGNADDYAAWCGTVEGLLRVRVLPLARGAGTVDIVAVGGADRGEVTEDFAAYAVELAAIQDGRLPAPEGMAALREAIARQKGAHLTVTAVPCAALLLDRAECLHGGVLELAWGEIAEG